MPSKNQTICKDCLNIKTCKDIPKDFELINCTDKTTIESSHTSDSE